jgi:uncharacterized repeat protein (TIGR01451 family)
MIVDTLPREVSFVSAEGDGIFGAYDLDTHTYTWVYPSLLPGSGVCLSLVVQVGRDITPGTTISNTVTVENRDVAAQTASVSAIAETREILPVDLVKTVTAGIKGQDQSGQYVVPGQSVTYTICASNNTDVLLGNVTIIDNLPPEVTFDSADGDDDIGRYDPATHSYTWSFPQIDAGATICANITVIVNKNVGPGTSIVNEAQLETGDTFVSTIAELFTESDSSPTTVPLSLSPLIIAREGFNRSEELTATLAFSAGVEPSDIPSEPVVLSPGSLVAKTQTVSLENGILKIRAKFDLHRVLNAIPEDGLTTLTVSGQLRSGRTFVGTGNILVVAVRPY